MQLPRDAAPLGQRSRRGLALARVLELGQQQFGVILALPAAPDELAGHRQQQAEQRGGDGRLGARMGRQADRRGEPDGDRPGDGRGRDSGSLTAAIETSMLAAISTGPSVAGRPAPRRTADQQAHRGLGRRAAAGPADADRGDHRHGVRRERDEHAQAGAVQAGRGMSLGAGRDHVAMNSTPSGRSACRWASRRSRARSRLGHPGRSGLVLRGAVRQARRARPCLHGPSVALAGGDADQARMPAGVRTALAARLASRATPVDDHRAG